MSKLDEWDDIVKHAKTCVDYDPTEYDQTVGFSTSLSLSLSVQMKLKTWY